jgi:hypothetical protein
VVLNSLRLLFGGNRWKPAPDLKADRRSA